MSDDHRRRTVLATVASIPLPVVAGCTGRDEPTAGELYLNNRTTTERTVRITVSAVAEQSGSKTGTPTRSSERPIELSDTVSVAGDERKQVGKLQESGGDGHVYVTATLVDGKTVGRWIEVPTRFYWTINVVADGTLTWQYSGIE